MHDLWPDDLSVGTLRAPVAILKEQAAALGRRTRNLVEAEVVSDVILADSGRFRYHFNIFAPTLGGYRYRILTIMHGIELYPVGVMLDRDGATELTHDATSPALMPVGSEAAFLDLLRAVFRSSKVKRVTANMLTQLEPLQSVGSMQTRGDQP